MKALVSYAYKLLRYLSDLGQSIVPWTMENLENLLKTTIAIFLAGICVSVCLILAGIFWYGVLALSIG